MVRTKSDRVPAKVSGGKSAAKSGKSAPMRTTSTVKVKGLSGGGGGNRAHPRDTPEWQKPITGFFNQSSTQDNSGAGSSTSLAEENPTSQQGGNDSE